MCITFMRGVCILGVCQTDKYENCTASGTVLYRSIDRGHSWVKITPDTIPVVNDSDAFSYAYGNDMLVLVSPEGNI